MPISGKMIRLIYFSTSNLESDPLAPLASLQALIWQAMRNNVSRGITGALLYDGERFAQVVEGWRDDVDALFRRIQQDSRHEAVTLIQRDAVRRRAFPRWSAMYVDPAEDDYVTLAQTAPLCPAVKDDPSSLLALLRYCVCSPA